MFVLYVSTLFERSNEEAFTEFKDIRLIKKSQICFYAPEGRI